MAAIVRLKRRRDADPVESLVISSKRVKTDENGQNTEASTSVFKFAGSLCSKGGEVTTTVKNAIRKEKLQQGYKQHYETHGGCTGQTSYRHKQRSAATQKARYQMISSKRAVNLDELEKQLDEGGSSDSESSKENASDRRVWFCDIVPENLTEKQKAQLPQRDDVITCNNVAMTKEKLCPENCAADDEFVFDIYYTNSADIKTTTFEDILSIETYTGAADYVHNDSDDDDELYDDEDDENAEGNWRNDYPDEDPDGDQQDWRCDDDDKLVDYMDRVLDLDGEVYSAKGSTHSASWYPSMNYDHYQTQLHKLHDSD